MRKNRLSGTVLKSLATLALASTPFVLTSPVQADTSSSSEVAQGVGSQVLQQAQVFGNTPADTPVTVSIVLKANNEAGLQQLIQQQTTPGSSQFRKYLSVADFAKTYGQSPDVINAITSYLSSFGITTTVYADNLNITASGTAGQFDNAFGVQLQNMSYKGHQFHGARAPKVPSTMAGPILAVLGLTNYGNFASNAVKQAVSQQSNSNSSSSIRGLKPADMEKQYDVTPLVAKGDTGKGQTIGIVTLAALDMNDPTTFWKQVGVNANPNRITVNNIDGGPGAPSSDAGSGETALDVEQSGAVAPGAHIDVYQAPNTDYGFADAFFSAVNDNQAGSISMSWGMSEDAVNYLTSTGQESANYSQVFNEIAEQAASQGISVFASSGDSGAYAAARDLGTTDLGIIGPADSPYITAAGGTTLPGVQNYGSLGVVNITQERAWGWDYLWPVLANAYGASEDQIAEAFPVGGGGGYSRYFATPWYQQGVPGVDHYSAVQWLTPTQDNNGWTFHQTPATIQGQGAGRATPDLSMDADPQTGYALYSETDGGWMQEGGTSVVAPQLAGLAALINQDAGQRVGFWNGQIYRFATHNNSPFNPLNATGTSNDNLYYSGTAGTLYNPATGLGTPDVAALATDFEAGAH